MPEAIFLSASVPDPKRGAEYAKTADTVAITAAVSALIHVTMGRRILVWGGHPAITPMIWVMAEGLGVDYGAWVRLYQTEFFEDEFPEDNAKFKNVTYTPSVENDREKSLQLMRERMLMEHQFSAGVFIGGMGGIVQEFDLFHALQPTAKLVPLFSTGGAVLGLKTRAPNFTPDLDDDMDYVGLLHRRLDISVREERFNTPADQPSALEARYWKAPGDA
jgi:hypothetical protein